MFAVKNGRIGIVSRGADVNLEQNGWTPVIIAVYKGFIDIMEVLINAGAKIN